MFMSLMRLTATGCIEIATLSVGKQQMFPEEKDSAHLSRETHGYWNQCTLNMKSVHPVWQKEISQEKNRHRHAVSSDLCTSSPAGKTMHLREVTFTPFFRGCETHAERSAQVFFLPDCFFEIT